MLGKNLIKTCNFKINLSIFVVILCNNLVFMISLLIYKWEKFY